MLRSEIADEQSEIAAERAEIAAERAAIASKTNLYDVLGFDPKNRKNITSTQIKKAFRKLASKHHPDKASESDKKAAQAVFLKLYDAYTTLSNDDGRAFYDCDLIPVFGNVFSDNSPESHPETQNEKQAREEKEEAFKKQARDLREINQQEIDRRYAQVQGALGLFCKAAAFLGVLLAHLFIGAFLLVSIFFAVIGVAVIWFSRWVLEKQKMNREDSSPTVRPWVDHIIAGSCITLGVLCLSPFILVSAPFIALYACGCFLHHILRKYPIQASFKNNVNSLYASLGSKSDRSQSTGNEPAAHNQQQPEAQPGAQPEAQPAQQPEPQAVQQLQVPEWKLKNHDRVRKQALENAFKMFFFSEPEKQPFLNNLINLGVLKAKVYPSNKKAPPILWHPDPATDNRLHQQSRDEDHMRAASRVKS